MDLSQQAGGFILLSMQLHFNLNARLEEGPLSPDLWNGDICGPGSGAFGDGGDGAKAQMAQGMKIAGRSLKGMFSGTKYTQARILKEDI